MVGAFLAGAVLDSDMFDRGRLDSFRSVVLLALMPVYFLSTGLKAQWSADGLMVLGGAALLFMAAFTGKLIGVGIAGRLLRWPRGDALVVGCCCRPKAWSASCSPMCCSTRRSSAARPSPRCS